MDEQPPSDLTPASPWKHAGHRAAKNTIVLIALRLVVPMLSLALVFTLSRALGAEGLGRYTLVFSFLTLLGGLGPLGLPTVVTRDGAGDRARLGMLLRNGMTLGALASIVLTLLMMAAGPLLNYDAETRRGLFILSFALFPYAMGMFMDSAVVALERMEYMAAATVAEHIFKVAVAIVLLVCGFGLNAVLLTAVVGRVVGALVCARLLHRAGVRVGFGLDQDTLRSLLRLAPTFLFIMVFATLYWRIDILMLSKLAAVEDLGYYGAAYRLFEVATVFAQSLCLSLYPQIAAAVHSDRGHLRLLGRNATRYLIAVSLPAAIFVTLVPRQILELLYGAQFDAAAATLSILIWTLLPYSVVRYHAYLLVAANRQRIDLLLNIVMSLVNIALNLVLIPRFSHLGAACATLVSLCMLAVLQYEYLRRHLPGHAATVSVQPVVLIGAALVGLCTWLLRDSSIFIGGVLAPMLYVIVLLVGGFFTSAELKFLHVDRLLDRAGLLSRRRQ